MESIFKCIKDKKILLTAHRGVNGGNIPCNSLQSYLIAIEHGADIIELDITVSKDRKLFLLHPGMESVHLGIKQRLPDLDSSEIKKLFLCNQDICQTQYPIATFDEVLEALKDKCYINVDKFWSDPEMISKVIRDHKMSDQCIVKSYADVNTPNLLKEYAYDMQYMAMIRSVDQDIDALYDPSINFIGYEVLFSDDSNPICSKKFIDKLHSKNKIVWGNSIVYNYKDVIAGEHTDDVALLGNPDKGWGWFVENNFDILQTDWVLAVNNYYKGKGYRK